MKKQKQYQKETEELIHQFVSLTTKHTERLALKFVNDMAKLDYEYKDVVDIKK